MKVQDDQRGGMGVKSQSLKCYDALSSMKLYAYMMISSSSLPHIAEPCSLHNLTPTYACLCPKSVDDSFEVIETI